MTYTGQRRVEIPHCSGLLPHHVLSFLLLSGRRDWRYASAPRMCSSRS